MSAENPTLEDFGFDSTALMIEVQRETMGKLIKAEAENAKLQAALEKYQQAMSWVDTHDPEIAESARIRFALANEQEGKMTLAANTMSFDAQRLNEMCTERDAEIKRLRAALEGETEADERIERQLRAEVAKLRAALEFYALAENYLEIERNTHVGYGPYREPSLVNQDRGKRAKAALANEPEGE